MLVRGRTAFSILNLYPYNNGHLMIAPYRHVARIQELTPAESAEIFRMAQESVTLLERTLKPEGFNLGFNLGRIAGAGYDGHAHLHVVPRWGGDTNFMPVVAGDKVISESLSEVRRRLLAARRSARGRRP
ncbi:MAG: AP-4-A phosphorylase [Candidatus Omnitrophica bacterium]|nr:AP-4-A phosphorylase [Candidatus Omnitrophota bacterium]